MADPKQVDIRRPERSYDVSAGVRGRRGAEGKSAYDLAILHGFEGSEVDFLESLQGKNGLDGVTVRGLSAYEVACEYGFIGSVLDWLNSLHGRNGIDSTLAGKDGEDGQSIQGLSAFEIAKQNGYPGTMTDWLLSLVGRQGSDGKIDTRELLKKDASEDITGNLFVINNQTDSDFGESVLTVASKPKWFSLLNFSKPRRYLKAVMLVANALERRVQFEGAAIIEADGEILIESRKMESSNCLLTKEAIEVLVEEKIIEMESQL